MNVLWPLRQAVGEVTAIASELSERFRVAAAVLLVGIQDGEAETVPLTAESQLPGTFDMRSLVAGAHLVELGPENTAFLIVPEGPKLDRQIVRTHEAAEAANAVTILT